MHAPRLRRLLVCGLAAATIGALGGRPAHAHAFGARYDLPLPLDLYIYGAGAAVALSFVVMALVVRRRPPAGARWQLTLPVPQSFWLAARALLGAVAVALFVLVLAAGLFGDPDPTRNIAPTFVWVIWWVGFAYLAALFGNLWPAVNPWAIVFAGIDPLLPKKKGHVGPRPVVAYPSWLGAWPAVLAFMLFAWFELISEVATLPDLLVQAVLIYSLFTWLAMSVFGRAAWLANGEVFSLAFSVFGRFAPLGAPAAGASELRLRPYAADLVVDRACRLSTAVFVLTMLATVTFDGFKETPLWGSLLQGIAHVPALYPLLRALHDLGFDFQTVIETAVLVLFPLLFVAVYLGFAWLTKRAAGSARPVRETAGLFVLSLVPIAIAYHLAHYLSYLLITGQYIVPLVSDPFGVGWNLFGTAHHKVDITIIGARFVWYAAVVAIVVGHVLAVGVAHVVALKVFDTGRAALRSQVPFLVLMVGYTMVSLWILAQPIVGAESVSRLASRSGSVSLAPFAFREHCVDLAESEALTYSFDSDRPLDFEIHYHVGMTTPQPVARSDTRNHADRFVATRAQTYCFLWLNEGLAPASLTYDIARDDERQ